MVDDDNWRDRLTGLLGFAQPQPEPKQGSSLMKALAPALEAGQVQPHELALLKGISEYANDYPMPREATTGQKLMGGGFQAIGAGLARGAGASVEGALAPTGAMVQDWQNRRDLADQARVGAWKATGDSIIPRATAIIDANTAQRRLEAIANMQAQNYGLGPIYKAREPAAAAPTPAPAVPQGEPKAVPGISVAPPATPGQPPAAQPQAASSPPGGEERPHQVGRVSFYTPEWAGQFERGLRALLTAPNVPISVPTKKEDGVTVNQEIKTPADLERVALQEDAKAYQATMGYIGRKKGTEEATSAIVKNNADIVKGYGESGNSARNAFATTTLLRRAYDFSKQEGQLGVGFGGDVLGMLNAGLQRMGLPHQKQNAKAMIDELANRLAIEGMKEETGGGQGSGAGQRTLLAFLKAVPSSNLTPEGFVAALEAIDAINGYHVARQEAVEKLAPGPEAYINPHLRTQVETHARPAFDKAVAAADKAMQTGLMTNTGTKGSATEGKSAAAGPAPEALAQAKVLYAKATPEQQAKMVESWKARGYDPAELGVAPQAAAKPPSEPQVEPASKPRVLIPPGATGLPRANSDGASTRQPATPFHAIGKFFGDYYDKQNKRREEELERIRRLTPAQGGPF